jgi:hypothetical protein
MVFAPSVVNRDSRALVENVWGNWGFWYIYTPPQDKLRPVI